MKQKSLPKSFLFALASFSLAAFLFVNVHAGLNIPHVLPDSDLTETQVQENDEANNLHIKTPDITVIGRLMDAAHHLLR